MEKTCLLLKIYLSLHFSPEWEGVTKKFKVYNVHQVHTFDKEKKIGATTYHIDSMLVPFFEKVKVFYNQKNDQMSVMKIEFRNSLFPLSVGD